MSIEQKLLELNDLLCETERMSAREYTLALIPHDPKEELQVSVGGKPVLEPRKNLALSLAFQERAKTDLERGAQPTTSCLPECLYGHSGCKSHIAGCPNEGFIWVCPVCRNSSCG